MDFSPASCEHLEFSNINQTISIVNTEVDQYRVNEVTYKSSVGVIFKDMVIICSGNSFRYSSRFEYAVPRKAYYCMLSDDTFTLTTHSVNNIVDLPENYSALYQVDNPADSSTVTFYIKGQQRHATQSTNSDGSSTTTWGSWYSLSTSYTITLTTNMDKHMELIRKAAKNGAIAKKVAKG